MTDHKAINNATSTNQEIISKLPVHVNIFHDRQTITFGSDIPSDFVKLRMLIENCVQEDRTHDLISNDQKHHEHFNQSKSLELSRNSRYFESS